MTLEKALEIVKALQLNNEQEELALLDLLMLLEEMEEPTDPPDEPPTEPGPDPYIWISPDRIRTLPRSGEAWDNLLAVADDEIAETDLLHQNNKVDTLVLAKAYLAVVFDSTGLTDEVMEAIERLMLTDLTPSKVNILGAARTIAAYVIAADVIDLKSIDPELDNVFREWLTAFRDIVFTAGNDFSIRTGHETRPNNIGLHCGAARVAIARYLNDDIDLARAATVFKGWLGDREAYAGFKYDDDLSWHADPNNPVGINPKGAMIDGHDVGGVLPDDLRRGGSFTWPPNETGYVAEALQGALVQAALLDRAGFPAFDWCDKALLRAYEWYHNVAGWKMEGDDGGFPFIVNHYYGTDFPGEEGAGPGKGMGWLDWTHQSSE